MAGAREFNSESTDGFCSSTRERESQSRPSRAQHHASCHSILLPQPPHLTSPPTNPSLFLHTFVCTCSSPPSRSTRRCCPVSRLGPPPRPGPSDSPPRSPGAMSPPTPPAASSTPRRSPLYVRSDQLRMEGCVFAQECKRPEANPTSCYRRMTSHSLCASPTRPSRPTSSTRPHTPSTLPRRS